jgi:hypothetical protein
MEHYATEYKTLILPFNISTLLICFNFMSLNAYLHRVNSKDAPPPRSSREACTVHRVTAVYSTCREMPRALSSSDQLIGIRTTAVQPDDNLALVAATSQTLEGQLHLVQVEDSLPNLTE